MIFLAILLLLLHIFVTVVRSSTWNITVQLNPACVVDCDDFNVVHAVGRCSNSSIHFLFVASKYISPSVLALHSNNPNSNLTIDWNQIANHTGPPVEAIKLDGVQQSYAIVFTNLVEYNDTHDQADLAASGDQYTPHKFSQLSWELNTDPWAEVHELKDDEIFRVSFTGNSSDSDVFSSNGSIKLEFMLSSADHHNPQLPHLRFIPGFTIQFELHLIGLMTNYTRGRFATQLALVSWDSLDPTEDFRQTTSVSINDEVTPGTFEMIVIQLDQRTDSPPSNTSVPVSGLGAFIQTRPVCYMADRDRQVSKSRDVRLSPRRDRLSSHSHSLSRSLPYWFYGDRLEDTVGIRVQNVSFGTPRDGYYGVTKYVVWSASFGFGRPPVDSLSALLIGLISLSVVVILASGLFGVVVLVVLRLKSRHRTGASEPLLQPDPIA